MRALGGPRRATRTEDGPPRAARTAGGQRRCEAAGWVVEEAGRLYVANDQPRVYVKLILITHTSNGNILVVMVANNLVARRD